MSVVVIAVVVIKVDIVIVVIAIVSVASVSALWSFWSFLSHVCICYTNPNVVVAIVVISRVATTVVFIERCVVKIMSKATSIA